MVSLYDPNAGNPNPTNPNPYPYDDFPWWNWNPYGNTGYDPYAPTTTGWQDQILQPVGGGQPDVDANGNPVFRTDVVDTAPPVETTGSDIGQLDPGLAEYLASLSGGGTPGGTGADFSVTGYGNQDLSYTNPDDPVFKTDVFDTTDPDDPIKRGDYKTYWDFPTGLPDYKEPFQGWPDFEFTPNLPPSTTRPPINGPVLTVPPRTTPGPTPTPTPQPQQPGGKQQQQPGVGKLLAALPMLAAFQGGTTTTPAPYAHLGPHTPVKSVFGPQAPGKRIPSIGQLLAGVR